MSLVEVMVAFAVMTVVLLAILGAILQAYRMNEEARRRDQVRALLQSFADDFACERVRINGNTTHPLFVVTTAPTGEGLSWFDSAGTETKGDSAGLRLHLGGDDANPEVTINRWVREVDETETVGTPNQSTDDKSSVGREIVGEFTATYRVLNRTRTITLSVVRADT